MTATTDLYAEVGQSACDKLLQSIDYPFVIMEKKQEFPGCKAVLTRTEKDYYRYTNDETDEMLRECVNVITKDQNRTENTVHDDLYSFGGSIIQQAKLVLEAQGQQGYEGPSKEDLETIIGGGIAGLGKNLRAVLGDFGIYAWNSHLRITLKNRPTLSLRSPRIELDGVEVEILARGELWVKYPWWNCHQWCTKWKKVIKCNRIASATATPDIAIDAHADIVARGARVYAKAQFDKLRLDYDILREIPLENVANSVLGKKEVVVYDAAGLVASVPAIGANFAVDTITLPPNEQGNGVGVTIKEV